MTTPLNILDAGTMPYREAWDLQLQLHEKSPNPSTRLHFRAALMLVRAPPVITIGRHPDAQKNLLASPKLLQLRGVEVVETDRGGDITFHGPGQLVAYPIIPLNHYNLNLHAYLRLLEEVIIQTLAHFQIPAERSQGATGVWTKDPNTSAPDGLAKFCAIGIKLRRWVTFHGIALNVSTDLTYFDLINPCGLGRPVTSLHPLQPTTHPTNPTVKYTLTTTFQSQLSALHPPT